jgi:hypothetical protein
LLLLEKQNSSRGYLGFESCLISFQKSFFRFQSYLCTLYPHKEQFFVSATMAPKTPLPLDEEWGDVDAYIESLLSFATCSDLFRNLCGGIHILDFLTREPDLYTTVLALEWRYWLEEREIGDVLDLLLREDIKLLIEDDVTEWRGGPTPPRTLLDFVHNVRRHSLKRDFCPPAPSRSGKGLKIPRTIAIGMNPKKIHEVENFAQFVDRLAADLGSSNGEDEAFKPNIIDFGSGQNYLGRALAGDPFHKHVYAVERKHENIFGAQGMDILAKVAKKKKVMRNKKEYMKLKGDLGAKEAIGAINQAEVDAMAPKQAAEDDAGAVIMQGKGSRGSVTYVEHEIKDGDLKFLFDDLRLHRDRTDGRSDAEKSIVVSLHSCGNLSNHGIRSLILNPSVTAIAMIGCCYNLLTERLGPATYKLPILRPYHPRLESTSNAYDPHGFPMSKRLELFEHKNGQGVRLNITARMMAVQAPYNWGPVDSEAFFSRHFYRAVLQRIFLDHAIVSKPSDPDSVVGVSPAGTSVPGTPLIVGSLRKQCFTSFRAYVRGAIASLLDNPSHGAIIREKLSDLSDEEIDRYEEKYREHKKKLSVIWSLMAFAASVVESIVVVDRWLYLREQEFVRDCWVEPVFDYAYSPRNLVVVGVKK